LFSSQLFKSKIEKEAASFASSRKISVSVAKTILMKTKWNTPTASKLLSNSKYGDKLVRSRKSHCDGKSENFWQPVFKQKQPQRQVFQLKIWTGYNREVDRFQTEKQSRVKRQDTEPMTVFQTGQETVLRGKKLSFEARNCPA
jgi:hypothetical protein